LEAKGPELGAREGVLGSGTYGERRQELLRKVQIPPPKNTIHTTQVTSIKFVVGV